MHRPLLGLFETSYYFAFIQTFCSNALPFCLVPPRPSLTLFPFYSATNVKGSLLPPLLASLTSSSSMEESVAISTAIAIRTGLQNTQNAANLVNLHEQDTMKQNENEGRLSTEELHDGDLKEIASRLKHKDQHRRATAVIALTPERTTAGNLDNVIEIAASCIIPRFARISSVSSQEKIGLDDGDMIEIPDLCINPKFLRKSFVSSSDVIVLTEHDLCARDGPSNENFSGDLIAVDLSEDAVAEDFLQETFAMIRYGLLVLTVWIMGMIELLAGMLAAMV